LITYTVTITNNGWDTISSAYFTATFPPYLIPVSASPGVERVDDEFLWSDDFLVPNDSKTFTYTARISGSVPLGTVISQTSWLAYPDHNIIFDRITDLPAAPDLSTSRMEVTPNRDVEETDALTYTITLRNNGTVDAPEITTTNSLPQMLDLIMIDSPSSGDVISGGNNITWTTALSRGEVATLTFRTIISARSGGMIENVAYVEDGVHEIFPLPAQATFKPILTYLPIIFKNQ
jgi:uncharacterized repeat protein (TIGR01451 family)